MHMILHKASSRGVAEHGWLLSHHTFSFANYFNPERMGFGVLRVINDDVVTPSMGFDTHAHQNMEIISIPLKGSLKHSDTMGNDFVIKKNEVQVMSAGIGVSHSEYNNSAEEDVNFLQIWVLPRKKDVYPKYSQKEFFEDDRLDKFQLIVSPDGRGNSLQINQDAYFSLIKLSKDKSAIYSKYKKDHGVYFFVIEGNISINENDLEKRDGLGVEDKDDLKIISSSEGEILIIEVPMLERLEG